MRFELVMILLTGFLIANVYTEGKYLKQLLSYKKYYQMAGIAFGGIMAYWLLKKNPQRANEMFATSHEYLKYLPVDQNTSNVISPIMDFTSKQNFSRNMEDGQTAQGKEYKLLDMFLPGNGISGGTSSSESRLLNSGRNSSKRSVSETKKKYVASRQNWACGDCGEQLSAWFEVDHKLRLEYGGSNHIDNLVALCRECHGKKTTIENL
uniref:HNH nuclease domain-containing protein n=1 Tax=viral metagenome TaxID=1070528 RepID=A0A6C0CPE6_9ZZZZ